MSEMQSFNQEYEELSSEDKSSNDSQLASTPIIVLVTLYLVMLAVILIYGLVVFWPPPDSPDGTVTYYSEITFIFGSFTISNEMRLLLIVAMAGALGSLVHGFRSLFWYVGNRDFVRSWILMYILLPLVGLSMSLVFYFVLRGGLFSSQAPVQATSTFGFAGLAGLVGMFSNQAGLKLKEVAESVFSTKGSTIGKDHVPTEDSESETEEVSNLGNK